LPASPPRTRSRRVTLLGVLQLVVLVGGTVGLSVGGFLWFRSVATGLLSSCKGGGCAAHAIDQTPGGASGTGGRVDPLPSIEAVITEALTWDPPLASGAPTPLDSAAALPIKTGDHVLGSQLAPITLMLFGDLQCRYVLRTFRTLSRRVQEQPAELRLVWRQRPLDIHPDAPAMAAHAERLALQQDETAFWRYVRALSRLKGTATIADATTIALALQKHPPRVSDDVAGERAKRRVQSDERIAAAYAIHDTPTLFVNGLRVEGDFSERDLDEILDEEREVLKSLQHDRIPKAKLYAMRVHENLLDLEFE